MDEVLLRIEKKLEENAQARKLLQETWKKRDRELKVQRAKAVESWMKKLARGLDAVLTERFGDEYWKAVSQQQIYEMLLTKNAAEEDDDTAADEVSLNDVSKDADTMINEEEEVDEYQS